MKRIFCLAIALMMVVTCFSGCGKTDNTSSDDWEWIEEEIVTSKDKNTSDSTASDSASDSDSSNGESSSVKTPSTTHTGGDLTVEGAGEDKNADYTVSGTVTVSINTSRGTDYEALFDSFKKVYPKVKLKFDYYSGSSTEYLSTRASANNLPDIVYDNVESLPTFIIQGWVHPLDSFVKNDPDYKSYVPDSLKKDYTYGGKLYALPHQATFEMFLMNTDVLKAISQPEPGLDWTINDFEKYCRAATTDKYSAQEDFGALYSTFANCFKSTSTLYGYNSSSKKFEAEGLIGSVKFLKKLRAVPGLEANSLKGTNGKDYAAKFGTGGWSDGWVAFHKGLTLFHGLGTWEYKNKRETVTNFNWKMQTVPQSSPGVMPYHVDHCFMTSTCKNTAAAWQLLRYCTYSWEGNIARLSMYDDANKGKYAVQNSYYFPTCTNPKVKEKFFTLSGVKSEPAVKYAFENIDKCYRYDYVKIVPGWNSIIISGKYYDKLLEAVNGADGQVDQTINQLVSDANKQMSDNWSDFNSKLTKVQSQFKG